VGMSKRGCGCVRGGFGSVRGGFGCVRGRCGVHEVSVGYVRGECRVVWSVHGVGVGCRRRRRCREVYGVECGGV
jgi:hypothetical protein